MTFQDLEYLIELSETKHIKTAAENLFMTYQALRVSLNRLEEELGGALFDRTTPELKLTPFGEFVIEQYVRPCLKNYHGLKDSSRLYGIYTNRRLKIGIFPQDLDEEDTIRQKCLAFAEKAVDADIEFVDIRGKNVRELLNNKELDAAVGWVHPWDDTLGQVPVIEREYFMFVNRENELAGKETVTLEDISEQILMLSKPDSFMAAYLNHKGISPKQTMFYTPREALAKKLLEENSVVVINRKDTAPFFDPEKIVLKAFSPPVFAARGILFCREEVPKQVLVEFIEHMENDKQ